MRYIAFLSLLVLLCSCDNELNVIEDRKDIPIVYGFLTASDSAQYIRLEKAFVDPSTSALELAQIPDSLYYDDSEIKVEILNEDSGISYELERVDGNLEGYVRDEGVFAQSPNYLYKILSSAIDLDDESEYILTIDRGETFPLITAKTSLVGESRFISPNPLISTPKLDFNYDGKTNISWSAGRNAVLYNLDLEVNYIERPIGGDFTDKQVSWSLASNLNETNYKQPGQAFYAFMASAIDEDSNVERRLVDFNIILDSGNNELLEYVRVGQANLGITSTQDIPNYTNLKAEGESYGRGIFASRYTKEFLGVQISRNTLDSLVNGSITKHLNFLP